MNASKIGPVAGLPELDIAGASARADGPGGGFAKTLRDALESVDRLQKQSDAAQSSFAAGEDVDLHDVLIKVEEADVAFKTMMEIRNKLVDAYREVMRMGS